MHGGCDIYTHDIDIDLSVNLNPYKDERVTGQLDAAVRKGIEASSVYPDITQREVRKALAGLNKITPMETFAGNGASELITTVIRYKNPGTALLIEPCFTGYERALSGLDDCEIMRYFIKEEDGFALTDDVLSVMTNDTDMMFLTDPWNPTGQKIDEGLLGRILTKAQECGITVLLDESFRMTGESRNYPGDVYVIRSFTKSFALPGIRMGYVLAGPDKIAGVRGLLPEWNLSCLADHVMRTCANIAQEGKFFDDSLRYIETERNRLSKKLEELGFVVFKSDSVFLLCKGPEGLYEELIRRRILIRKCDDLKGLGDCFYRIAVKSREENDRFIGILEETLEDMR